MQVPYPLSTSPNCGNPEYSLRCDSHTQKLYFDTLNGSSYLVLRIQASVHRMVVKTSPWIPGTCVTQDMPISEGLWLSQTLPFNVTSSNTVFFFNCSPRLLVSPLNCSSASLCHQYLEQSGRVDPNRARQCVNEVQPCCSFLAGGMPSAYKIRLHASGCRAFRSILHLDTGKPASEWEEGLEIQWALYHPNLSAEPSLIVQEPRHALGTCSREVKNRSTARLGLKVATGICSSFFLVITATVIALRNFKRVSNQAKLAKSREDMLKASNGGKSSRIFSLKEVKKATCGFCKDRILGIGGFGEVYKGELHDGTVVAVKSAKVGNIKSTNQVLNEVGILSQVNHKHLVRLLGCCIEAELPLMIYEYIPNGTLHDHLQRKFSSFLNWKTRLKISLQTAEALSYLQSSAYTPIYHRDVKSTNILLDENMNAKVADFGLSRLAVPGLSHVSTCAQGTLGYLDPEYYRNYQLTDKSDVYSYGVVLLELLTSQKAIDFTRDQDDVNLAVHVNRLVSSDAMMEVVDSKLLDNEPYTTTLTSMKLFADLALACLREKKTERPSMKDVVETKIEQNQQGDFG
ncbi:hypothetical protein C5167_033777 [Papaver somniferum]|uniref:Protein kinase domain-containing protein n=1 Tax=Papaver somniferum TaxID=3469 RepID=A0A4Y7KFC2_PAPSO|nr:hypothetical protein C5167_033777 [Papaver somniferum]